MTPLDLTQHVAELAGEAARVARHGMWFAIAGCVCALIAAICAGISLGFARRLILYQGELERRVEFLESLNVRDRARKVRPEARP